MSYLDINLDINKSDFYIKMIKGTVTNERVLLYKLVLDLS